MLNDDDRYNIGFFEHLFSLFDYFFKKIYDKWDELCQKNNFDVLFFIGFLMFFMYNTREYGKLKLNVKFESALCNQMFLEKFVNL